MNKLLAIVLTVSVVFLSSSIVYAMKGMDDKDVKNNENTFIHSVNVDGIDAQLQIMKLSDMNLTDPEGKTHHIMVTLTKNGIKITKAIGKIKLIAPSEKSQTATLKDYGNGVFAANFIIDEPGKWGVIYLFKDEDGKHLIKFWYPHKNE